MGIPLTGNITTTDPLDTFPTHLAELGKGGHRTVATLVDRDAISADRLEEGMTVYVQEDGATYTLGADLVTWVDSIGTLADVASLQENRLYGVADYGSGAEYTDLAGRLPMQYTYDGAAYTNNNIAPITTDADATLAEQSDYYAVYQDANAVQMYAVNGTKGGTWSDPVEFVTSGSSVKAYDAFNGDSMLVSNTDVGGVGVIYHAPVCINKVRLKTTIVNSQRQLATGLYVLGSNDENYDTANFELVAEVCQQSDVQSFYDNTEEFVNNKSYLHYRFMTSGNRDSDLADGTGTDITILETFEAEVTGTAPFTPTGSIVGLSTVATTNDYNDLNNKPVLEEVATSGSYNDLVDKPIISLVSNTLSLDGTNIDLSAYLDDTTNTVVSASISGTQITLVREDTTTFTLEIGNILSSIGNIGDIDITGIADGSVLKYNGTTSKWEIGSDNGSTTINEDFEITDSLKGVILTSPDSTRWRITVDDNGNLTTTEVI